MAVKQDLVNKALRRMGLLRADSSTTDFRNTDLGAAYDEVYAELEEELLTPWASNGTVPAKLVDSVVVLMSFRRLADYTVAPSRSAQIRSDAGPQGLTAKSTIRTLIEGPLTSTTASFVNY